MGAMYGAESFADSRFSAPVLWGVLDYDGATNTYNTTETFEIG